MARAKRTGLADYGLFAQRYVESFDEKWVHGTFDSEELALGAGGRWFKSNRPDQSSFHVQSVCGGTALNSPTHEAPQSQSSGQADAPQERRRGELRSNAAIDAS
jgi:hypothetical protein